MNQQLQQNILATSENDYLYRDDYSLVKKDKNKMEDMEDVNHDTV